MPVDFTPTEEQRLLRTRAREFARDVLSGVGPATRHLPTAEERHRAMLPFYRQMVETGFLRQLVP
jgi:nitroalkane oxidase